EGIDAQLELAALTLGASRPRALWEVVVPLVAPGLLSALLFAFMVSFGDVYIALFLSGPGRTPLPIEIFAYMQWESTPVVAAITTIQILLIIGLGLVIERLVGLRRIMRVRTATRAQRRWDNGGHAINAAATVLRAGAAEARGRGTAPGEVRVGDAPDGEAITSPVDNVRGAAESPVL